MSDQVLGLILAILWLLAVVTLTNFIRVGRLEKKHKALTALLLQRGVQAGGFVKGEE